jgi:hypothetical protein
LYSSIRINKGRMSRIESTKRGGMRATAHANNKRIFLETACSGGENSTYTNTHKYICQKEGSRESEMK